MTLAETASYVRGKYNSLQSIFMFVAVVKLQALILKFCKRKCEYKFAETSLEGDYMYCQL